MSHFDLNFGIIKKFWDGSMSMFDQAVDYFDKALRAPIEGLSCLVHTALFRIPAHGGILERCSNSKFQILNIIFQKRIRKYGHRWYELSIRSIANVR